jgi:hypothetical protein
MSLQQACPHLEATGGEIRDGKPCNFSCAMCGKALSEYEYNAIGPAYLKLAMDAEKLRAAGRIAEAEAIPKMLLAAKNRFKLERKREAHAAEEQAFQREVSQLLPALEAAGHDTDQVMHLLLGNDPSAVRSVLALAAPAIVPGATPPAPRQLPSAAAPSQQLATAPFVAPPPPPPPPIVVAQIDPQTGLAHPVAPPTRITQKDGSILEIPAAPLPAAWVTKPAAPVGSVPPPPPLQANMPQVPLPSSGPTVITSERGETYQIPAAPNPFQ